MRVKFIQAKYKKDFEVNDDFIDVLKKRIGTSRRVGLYSSVQFLPVLGEVEKKLRDAGFVVLSSKPIRARFESQVLGCDSYGDSLNVGLDLVDAFVYVGDGLFHPTALLFAQQDCEEIKPVVCLNLPQGRVDVLEREEIERFLKKRKGNMLKFHTSSKIGVFVSSKWGQEYMSSALKLKEIYPDKKFYYFISDNLSDEEFDNFNFVECFVNTACPRIGQNDVLRISKPIVNIKDIWNK